MLFAAYLLILLWLVLFKFSYDPAGVIRDVQIRNLNLLPFSQTRTSEMIANIIAFVPFGVMLGATFKQTNFRRKMAAIFSFSLGVELLQYILAIGVTDVTDLIMNTLGGTVGLLIYALGSRYANTKYLDASILFLGSLALLIIVYLRVFVFIVRY